MKKSIEEKRKTNNRINKDYRERHPERIKARCKSYRENQKDGYYRLYYLPKDNYIGMTNVIRFRLYQHKHKAGRDTTGCRVLIKSKNPKFISMLEGILHWIGFNGFNRGNKR